MLYLYIYRMCYIFRRYKVVGFYPQIKKNWVFGEEMKICRNSPDTM